MLQLTFKHREKPVSLVRRVQQLLIAEPMSEARFGRCYSDGVHADAELFSIVRRLMSVLKGEAGLQLPTRGRVPSLRRR